MTDNELLLAISNMMDEKLDSKLKPMESQLTGLKEDVAVLKKKVNGIDLKLETEINHNIKVIAEGHLDLSRKLNEAVHLASDIKAKQEIQDLLIRSHETELKIRNIS